ncbi:MAG: HAD-IA family hydrolase [Cyanobacteria bacterium P01_H01_bin.119]
MTCFIFDFDGTIAKTLGAVVRIVNQLAPEFGYSPVNAETLSALQNLNTRQIIQQSELPRYKVPFLIRRLQRELHQEMERLELIEGMENTLRSLHHENYRLGIVTSNSARNVNRFLQQHQIDSLFDFVHTSTRLFGKSRVLRRVIQQYGLDPAAVIYVGDETRDIEAAQATGVRVAAVNWGFNSTDSLVAHQPDFLLTHPNQLLAVTSAP